MLANIICTGKHTGAQMADVALREECLAQRSHLVQLRTQMEELNAHYAAKADAMRHDDEAAQQLAADPSRQVQCLDASQNNLSACAQISAWTMRRRCRC